MKKIRNSKIYRKTQEISDFLRPMEISSHAAHTGYFMVLSAFPALVLLLLIMRNTFLGVDDLMELVAEVIPSALIPFVQHVVENSYSHSSNTIVSLSVLTALWSASNGIYALQSGMNCVYDCQSKHSYLRKKMISVAYTFLLLLVLLLTLVFHVFGNTLLKMMRLWEIPLVGVLSEVIDLRFFLLLFIQSVLFTAMYMVIPNRKNRLWESVPGALLASIGWMVFSDLFSIYVERFQRYSYIYGSVYAVALSMLWLYFCISIIFYGGALNAWLKKKRAGEIVSDS